MSYTDFAALYALENKCSQEELLAERPLSFPMSTNERGEARVSSLQSRAKLEFASKRVLDVGCTYGGLSIALAKSGVAVTGIDTSPKLIA